MTTWLISRHEGAAAWAKAKGLIDDSAKLVADLKLATLQPDDVVIGNLPAHLAAEVCELGAHYHHLKIDLEMTQRGMELSRDELERAGASIVPYRVEATPSLRGPRGKVLQVCVVSGEGLPNYLPMQVEGLKPNVVVLLASGVMARKADTLARAMEQTRLSKPTIRVDLPDHDVNAIIRYGRELATRLAAEYPNYRLLLNLTGGNKLIALGLFQGMRSRFEIFYCDTAHDRLEWVSPPDRGVQALDHGLLNLERYLSVQGLSAEPSNPSLPSEDMRHMARYLADQAAYLSVDFFRRLNNAAKAHDPRGHSSYSPTLNLTDQPGSQGIERQAAEKLLTSGFLVKSGDAYSVPKEEPKWSFLAGGWLEVYCAVVALALEREGLNRKRWGINVKVQPSNSLHQRTLQELDAVIVHRNRMLVIECKTGQQLDKRDGLSQQSILNRLEVVGDQVAGSFATRFLLATTDDFDNAVIDRAARYRIRLVGKSQLRDLEGTVREWMNP
jgi:putative CRISPR-associated protein (TIGR02620 family)